MWRKLLFFISTCFITLHLSMAAPQQVVMGLGNFEPYYQVDGEVGGIFVDIINATFKRMPEYQVEYMVDLSNEGLWNQFALKRVDAIANLFDDVRMNACRSLPVFKYKDIAISLKKNDLDIDNESDLEGINIVAFQGARMLLGDEFRKYVKSDALFEVPNQALQSRMLMAERVKVSVGDLYIFLSSLQKMKDERYSPQFFNYHDIFKPTASRIGFHDKALCDAFNQALEDVIDSGEYDAIYKKYLVKFDYFKYLTKR